MFYTAADFEPEGDYGTCRTCGQRLAVDDVIHDEFQCRECKAEVVDYEDPFWAQVDNDFHAMLDRRAERGG